MDPTLLAVLSIFGGAALTGLVGFIAAAIERRREHEKWVREKRYEAYVSALTLSAAMNSLADESAQMAETSASEDRKILLRERLTSLSEKAFEAAAPFAVLGPESVDVLLVQLTNAPTFEERNTAHNALIAEMRKTLKIKD